MYIIIYTIIYYIMIHHFPSLSNLQVLIHTQGCPILIHVPSVIIHVAGNGWEIPQLSTGEFQRTTKWGESFPSPPQSSCIQDPGCQVW